MEPQPEGRARRQEQVAQLRVVGGRHVGEARSEAVRVGSPQGIDAHQVDVVDDVDDVARMRSARDLAVREAIEDVQTTEARQLVIQQKDFD